MIELKGIENPKLPRIDMKGTEENTTPDLVQEAARNKKWSYTVDIFP